MRTLKNEGPAALGEVSDTDYLRVVDRLRKIIKGPEQNVLKPKAASKMIVSELKEELEAQGLPTDGTRQVLYQRVQKARRINRSRGRPLWVPPIDEEEEVVCGAIIMIPVFINYCSAFGRKNEINAVLYVYFINLFIEIL